MRFFGRLFGKAPDKPPLPPLEHKTLGRLTWDGDSESWVGKIMLDDKTFRLRAGGGSEHEYPSHESLELLAQAYGEFDSLAKRALVFLQKNGRLDVWKTRPEDLQLDGLETNHASLNDQPYAVVFTDPGDAIWSVQFREGHPIACGVDD